MIKFIRKYSNSKIAQILLGLLGLSFVFLWGIGGAIGPSNKDYIVKVGGEKITPHDFNELFSINNKLMQKIDLKDPSLKRQLVLQKTLNDLTSRAMLNIFSKENDLLFNSKVIGLALAKDERFLDKDNAFDKQKLLTMIKGYNNSESLFMEAYEESLKIMMLHLIFNGYKINNFYASKLLEAQHERRYIELKLFDPSAYNVNNNISQEDLEKFYEKNSHLFDIPELRTIEYVYVDKSKVNVKPTDDQLKAEFQKRVKAGEYFESEFETVKKDIALDVEDELNYEYLENVMKEIDSGLKAGKKLEELASKYECVSFKRVTFSKDNTDSNGNEVLTENFKEILLSSAFDTNKLNHSSDFIDTDDGGELLFLITDIQKSYTKSFEEVQEKIKPLYIAEKLDSLAKSAATEYTDKINSGDITEKIGDEHSYVRSDIKHKLKNLNREAFIKIFELDKGKATYAKVGNYYVVIKLKDTKLPSSQVVYEKIDLFKKSLNKQLSQDLVDQFISFSQKKHKIDINTQALRME